jgi:hypothetical protein
MLEKQEMTDSSADRHDLNAGEQQPPRLDGPDRQALLTMLTTEHFTLQGARANTVSESTARAALYVGSPSAFLGKAVSAAIVSASSC